MARKISFNTISQEKYDYLLSNGAIDEDALYCTTDTCELYKGSKKCANRMIYITDASEAPTDSEGNIIAEKDTFYVSKNGVIGAYIPTNKAETEFAWVKFTAGDTLDVSQTVMIDGIATTNPVSGVAVRDFVNNDTNKVYDASFAIKNVTGVDGVERKKAILTLKKVGNVNNVDVDLTALIDGEDSESLSEYYAKPILPSDLYYITAYNQTLYTLNMFEDAKAAKSNKVMIMARDDENDVTHTYLDEYYTVYMQNEAVQNTFATTDNNGNEFTKKVIFHSSNPYDCAGSSYTYQVIGDGLNARKNSENRSLTGLMIDKLKGEDYNLTLSSVGTKAYMETSEGWTLENLVGMSNFISSITDPMVTDADKVITRDESSSSGLNEKKNPFLKLSTDQDREDHPDWCFTNTGSANEVSYADEDASHSELYYIFDYAWYLESHSIKAPDIVTIAFGNEITTDLDKAMLALKIAVTQIKKACPNCTIGLLTPIAPSKTYQGDVNWAAHVAPFIERLISKCKELQNSFTNIYLVPQYLFVDRNFNYTTKDVTPTSIYNDSTKRKVNEGFALNDDGATEYISAMTAWLLNAMPHTSDTKPVGNSENTLKVDNAASVVAAADLPSVTTTGTPITSIKVNGVEAEPEAIQETVADTATVAAATATEAEELPTKTSKSIFKKK